MADSILLSSYKHNMEWRRIILLGLAYFGVAMIPAWVFGLRNIALLFPPVGVAFGAILIFGARLWPGVVLGCLLLGLFHVVLIDSWNWTSWLDVLINTTATLLTVLSGYWLMKRWVNIRQLLKGERNGILLVCAIAPIVCALGAGFIFLTYWIFDLAEVGSRLQIVFMWWLGDVTGILTMTPAMLIFFSYRNRHKRRYRMRILMSLGVMIALCFVVFAEILDWEEKSDTAAFMHAGDIATASLQEHLQTHEGKQRSLGQLARFTPDLREEDWHRIVAEWMEQHPGSAGFGHAVFMERNERASFEKEMRRKGLPAFSIREPGADGSIISAREAADYLPYIHIAPMEGKQDFIGMNAYSGNVAHDNFLLEQVLYGRATLVVSGALPWMPDKQEQKSVLLFQPVDDEKNARPMGITVSGIFMDDMVKATIDAELLAVMKLCLTFPLAEGGYERLYGESGCENPEWEKQKINSPVYRATISFGGQQWEVRALPTTSLQDPYLYQSRHYARQDSWDIYMLTCLMIFLLAFFFIFYTVSIQGEKALYRENTRLLRRVRYDLAQQEKFLELLQKVARLGCWEQNSTRFKGSDGLCRMFGIAPDALSDWRQLLTAMQPDGQARFMEALLRLEQHDNNVVFDVSLKSREGSDSEKTYIRFHLNSQTEEDGRRHIQGVAQDVTLEVLQEKQIQFLIYHDPVTQLGNCFYWDKQASQAIANAEKNGRGVLAIFEIALEDMENLVSVFGIAVSRVIQREVADLIRRTVRGGDIVTWRGDGFSCCMSDLKSASETLNVARELLQVIKRAPLLFERQEITLSISIGIALFPEDGRTLDSLQKNAVIALRAARAIGQDNFQFFEPGMNRRSVERLALESALRLGIPRNELLLHYQPQIHLADGKARSCEALARWKHPEKGMIYPLQFISLAEETGLVLPLGQWVFTEACWQQVRWKEYGITILINVSAMQFRWEHFVDSVAHILTETGADPKRIGLEITESTLMNLNDMLLERIYRLKGMGFELFLDDFGTGYCGLAYLKRLPISGLKLAQSFIADLPHDADSCAITTTAILMARELGMAVVAEGVENQAQVAFLQERHCDILQGYYFSKPLAESDFELWLREFES
ncbi:MAG: EAL domain-containing protein [Betaproteobacteria bacterium]|nr:EAL domain-containing protein [Betaproteobacteria bacterium]